MGTTPPVWVRALLGLNQIVATGMRGFEIVRDEILCAALPPERREDLIAWLYARQSGFARGGISFEQGLQDWERALLASPAFPRRGRILLGGAGGGRELLQLSKLGYEVVAFEPSRLVDSAAAVATGLTGGQVVRAAYGDLVRGVNDGTGPLAGVLSGHFDAVVLGWCSFSHVTVDRDRVALLQALHRLAPDAPVVLSYVPAVSVPARGARARRLMQNLLRPLGGTPGSRLQFSPLFGFMYPFTVEEISTLAETTGYRLVDADQAAKGRCIFVPKSLAS